MPDLPDVRQRDNFSCGEQAARVVLQYWGVKPRVIAVANPVDGTHPATVVAIFRAAGLRCITGEANLELVRAMTRAGMPVVCLVQQDGEGHYVVVGSVSRGRVRFQCPLNGPGSLSAAAFEAAWHDVDAWGTAFRRFVIVAHPAGE